MVFVCWGLGFFLGFRELVIRIWIRCAISIRWSSHRRVFLFFHRRCSNGRRIHLLLGQSRLFLLSNLEWWRYITFRSRDVMMRFWGWCRIIFWGIICFWCCVFFSLWSWNYSSFMIRNLLLLIRVIHLLN